MSENLENSSNEQNWWFGENLVANVDILERAEFEAAFSALKLQVEKLVTIGEGAPFNQSFHSLPGAEMSRRVLFIAHPSTGQRYFRTIVNDTFQEGHTDGRTVVMKDFMLDIRDKKISKQETSLRIGHFANTIRFAPKAGPYLYAEDDKLIIGQGSNYKIKTFPNEPDSLPKLDDQILARMDKRIGAKELLAVLDPLSADISFEPRIQWK
jgi:hypothetical protein